MSLSDDFSVVAVLKRIARYVGSCDVASLGGAVNDGTAGHALFLAYAQRSLRDDSLADRVIQMITHAAHWAHRQRDMALVGGSAGVAWVVQHLYAKIGLIEDDPLQRFDEGLLAYLRGPNALLEAELLKGLAGIASYLLERLPAENAFAGLEEVAKRLRETAVEDDSGLKWLSYPQRLGFDGPEYQPTFVNLGMAHGVPGVISVLARMHVAGVAGAAELLYGAAKWMVHACGEAPRPYWYPCEVLSTGAPGRGSRMAWCYGDVGIALALTHAAVALDDKRLRAFAHSLAVHAASVRDDTTPGWPQDASLCHGTAGLAQLFRCLAADHGDQRLSDAAGFWMIETLRLATTTASVHSLYASRQPRFTAGGHRFVWGKDHGLLTGASGVGLVLASELLPTSPTWSTVLSMNQAQKAENVTITA